MELRLKVLVGQSAGQELPVPGPKFLVGRAEDCQLRPRSDLISRHHCALLVEEGFVSVRDFGSKNGTLVNSERVVGERELKNGDKLTIGPLEFEVCLLTSVASKKQPKVESVKEAAARTAAAAGSDVNVDEWLKPDDVQSLAETRRMAMSETDEIDLGSTTKLAAQADAPSDLPKPHDAKRPDKKKTPGKLPPLPPTSAADSGKAASDVLNKFFKRR